MTFLNHQKKNFKLSMIRSQHGTPSVPPLFLSLCREDLKPSQMSKKADGCWFCFYDEAGQAAVRTRSLSLKNRRRNLSESLHHDAFEAIGNLHQMFSATITISALYQEKGAFASWHPFLHLFLCSSLSFLLPQTLPPFPPPVLPLAPGRAG